MEKLYRSMDGQLFKSEKECREHECGLMDWANNTLERLCSYYSTTYDFVGCGYDDSTIFVIKITEENFETLNKALRVLECNPLSKLTIGTIQLITVTFDGEYANVLGTMAEFVQQMLDRYNRHVAWRD